MSDKTKAALQSCQCHYQMFKQKQNTRLHAGGQSLSELQNSNSVLVGFSSNRGEVSKTYIRQWRTLDHTAKNYPDIGWNHSLSASLACLRWRRLISPLAAVTRNPAVLSPSYFKSSISSITSWGIRTVVICDFAFFAPVAIAETPCVRCISVYAKKIKEKALKCISLWASLNGEGDIHLVNAKPGCARNTNRASDHNVIGANNMADLQHTQTRPEFTWRFLSASERYPNAKPLVIYLNASSEQEARDSMPGVNLIFAARLPFHAFQAMEVRHA
ncbi:host cell division inhibitor Icd-like protein [Klebsiella pneumoniae]|uniref:host cell division inhibitor Icd-like protein n=1 Tax=Klebsiella TaxID=570 RepID=UPI0009832992|nr:host cell division inhibitor Icd-like protein [Klebsiella pneumoniae]MCF0353188.1 host cell division inhibitor Icd-like protein [Klebsiella pneumoniae]MCM5788903.1 host cell division inhibitor Icd-like protein [Klebsiella pneumoniae]MCM6097497.1 host cell division inhibitor Icd-like protein [Klebsiella pneumoniae]MCP5968599.1 host cell division inhibitor Icd-like protein [Klebsiella pneumoniae]MDF7739340.1 host cell division inhibitor Icd-like protein [Klebsiella pneumoniae]